MRVPANHAAVLPGGTPVAGDPASIEQAAAFTAEAAESCVSYGTALLLASTRLSETAGAAVAAHRAKLDTVLQEGATKMRRSAEEARRGFTAYAAEVERIHRQAQAVQQSVDDHLGTIRAEAATVSGIAAQIGHPLGAEWDAPPSPAMPEPVLDADRTTGMDAAELAAVRRTVAASHEETWRRAVVSWDAAAEAIRLDSRVWASLIEERERAERALLGALRGSTLGQLISVGSVAGGPGPKFAVAHGIAGELRGRAAATVPVVAQHPDLAGLFPEGDGSRVWDAPPAPEAAAAWWAALDEAARGCLIWEAPWVIGNLPGLPFSARDLANRRSLELASRSPAQLSPQQLRAAAAVQEVLRREADDILLTGSGRPPVQVVALNLESDVPMVALGYGDADSASHVAWAVPGMKSDAHLAIESWDEASRNLHEAQRGMQRAAGTNAVIAWLGYDTPDIPFPNLIGADSVLRPEAARVGARRLAAELDGGHAARAAGVAGLPVTGVLAHSYGTTTATIALTLIGQPVDTLTLIASAGLDQSTVPDYGALRVNEFAPGQRAVFTTHASDDRLAPSGAGLSLRGQPNPGAVGVLGLEHLSPVYGGGLAFSSDGDGERGLLATDGHSIIGDRKSRDPFGMFASYRHGYLDPDTQALDSIAQVTTGAVGEHLAAAFARTERACVGVRAGVIGGVRLERSECG